MTTAPSSAPRPTAASSKPDAALAELQQREGGDDDEDVDAAGGQRLAGEHARQQAEVGRPPRHAEAGEQKLPERRMAARAGHGRRLLDRQHEQRRPEQRNGHHDERRLHAGDGEHEACERRAGEHPQALDRRGDDVRHRQLLGRARELREEGDLSRSETPCPRPRQAREDVDERDRSVGDDDDERAEHEQRADEVAREHHPDAAVAIPECRRRGRRERAERPQDEHRADGRRAALLVRVHAERDLEAVVADDRAGPRDLQQPQLAVAEDRADGSVPFVGRAQGIRRSAQSRISPISPSKEIPAASAISVRSPTVPMGPRPGSGLHSRKCTDAVVVEPEVEPGDIPAAERRERSQARSRSYRRQLLVVERWRAPRTGRARSNRRFTSNEYTGSSRHR